MRGSTHLPGSSWASAPEVPWDWAGSSRAVPLSASKGPAPLSATRGLGSKSDKEEDEDSLCRLAPPPAQGLQVAVTKRLFLHMLLGPQRITCVFFAMSPSPAHMLHQLKPVSPRDSERIEEEHVVRPENTSFFQALLG